MVCPDVFQRRFKIVQEWVVPAVQRLDRIRQVAQHGYLVLCTVQPFNLGMVQIVQLSDLIFIAVDQLNFGGEPVQHSQPIVVAAQVKELRGQVVQLGQLIVLAKQLFKARGEAIQ
jgi:hypothetical protein